MEIQRVGVVGCGLMGSGIAEAIARANLDVLVVELHEVALSTGRDRVIASLASAQRAGKLNEVQVKEALNHIEYSTDMGSLADRQLIIEAVVESESEKVAIFEILDKVVKDPDAILASNTSSIPIMKLAMATTRPAQVIGIHFFNPVPVLPLVELVSSLLTSEETNFRRLPVRHHTAGKARNPVAGPCGFHCERSTHSLHSLGRTDARIWVRHCRRH